MTPRNTLFRAIAFLHHRFTAWNTGGEGIHSPYLFYMVRMLFYDRHSYYCFAPIEKERRALLASERELTVRDFGTGASLRGDTYRQSIAAIAQNCLEQPRVAQLLFRLAAFLGHEAKRPLEIVELGTSLGVTTAYLASADSRNRVTTFEGSPEIAAVAKEVWHRLDIENITLVEGNINDTLSAYRPKQVDIAYIDANHTECATWRYFSYLLPMAGEKSLFIVDDIHHSPAMEAAWQRICACEAVTTTMDLWSVGLVFFDPHYLRKHYTLRL